MAAARTRPITPKAMVAARLVHPPGPQQKQQQQQGAASSYITKTLLMMKLFCCQLCFSDCNMLYLVHVNSTVAAAASSRSHDRRLTSRLGAARLPHTLTQKKRSVIEKTHTIRPRRCEMNTKNTDSASTTTLSSSTAAFVIG